MSTIPRLLCLIVALLLHAAAGAVTREQVLAGAERMYRERIVELQSRYALDREPAFTQRLQRVAASLIAQTRREAPALANYYRKLARSDPNANFDSLEHPAPAQRWRAMRELAAQLAKAKERLNK
jgi:hypothetical protein